MTKCILCPEEASTPSSLCVACGEDPASIKWFIYKGQSFRIFLKAGGKLTLFRCAYGDNIKSDDFVIYISKATGNLFVGQICKDQKDLHDGIRIRRIQRSFGRQPYALIFDTIQFDEVACTLIPI
jgi:hypothetical protein